MFKVTLSHNIPDAPNGWPAHHAIMAQLIRDDWRDNDTLITVSLRGMPVALAHVVKGDNGYTLNALVSVFCGAGKLALGRAIAIARHDRVSMTIHSLKQSTGFYRHCGLREVSSLEFVS